MTRFDKLCATWLFAVLAVIAVSATVGPVPTWAWGVLGITAIVLISLLIAGTITQVVDEWRAETSPDAVLEPARDHGRRAA